MRSRRFTGTLAGALSGLMLLAAVTADAQSRQRQPQGTSSSSSGTAVRAPAPPPPSSSSRPPRVAVPKSNDSGDRADRSNRQRQDQGDDYRRGGDHHRGYYYPVYRGSYSYHPWFWWAPYYGFWGHQPWGYGAYWYPEQMHDGMGALDLDIKPEDAEIYLDGHKIGVADNFDGWPRHLWLEEGTYDLVFYHEGFETIARQYSIYPSIIVDVEDRMVRGDAVLPEDLLARSSERREERLRRRAERGEGQPAAWRDRVRSERDEMAYGEDDGYYDARAEPARLRLSVSPSDAAVYLDGKFLGTGEELGGVRAGLIVDPGEHELEVTRPGYESETETFTVEEGEEVSVEVELDEE